MTEECLVPLSVVVSPVSAIPVPSVPQTVGAEAAVSIVTTIVSVSIGGPLGHMDDSSRVGHVSSGSGVEARSSGDSGGSGSGDSYAVGTVGHSVPSVPDVGGGVGRVSGVRVSGQTAVAVAVDSVQSISISLGRDTSRQTNHNSNLDHVPRMKV